MSTPSQWHLCALCGQGRKACAGTLGAFIGPIDDGNRNGIGVYVHRFCALWSSEVYHSGDGSILRNVGKAIRRGRQLRCADCNERGATLGCRVDRCPLSYHLPCARSSRCAFNSEAYLIACPRHAAAFAAEQRHPRSGAGASTRTSHGHGLPDAPAPLPLTALQPPAQRQAARDARGGGGGGQEVDRERGEEGSRVRPCKLRRIDVDAASRHVAAARTALTAARAAAAATAAAAAAAADAEDDEAVFAAKERRRLTKDKARLAPVMLADGVTGPGAGGGGGVTGVYSRGFDAVGGLEHVVDALREAVLLPLMYPGLMERLGVAGAQTPRGILLHGPPGTGKTHVVRCLAGQLTASSPTPVALFARGGAELLGKYLGDAERALRLMFEEARRAAPSLIFLDELDALAPRRSTTGGGSDTTYGSVVATLLACMDGLTDRGQVIVIAATNRPDALDPALRRPGRFDRELEVGLPGLEDRAAVLAVHTGGWERESRPEPQLLGRLAEATEGFAGADLQALCASVVVTAMRRHTKCNPNMLDAVPTAAARPPTCAPRGLDGGLPSDFLSNRPSRGGEAYPLLVSLPDSVAGPRLGTGGDDVEGGGAQTTAPAAPAPAPAVDVGRGDVATAGTCGAQTGWQKEDELERALNPCGGGLRDVGGSDAAMEGNEQSQDGASGGVSGNNSGGAVREVVNLADSDEESGDLNGTPTSLSPLPTAVVATNHAAKHVPPGNAVADVTVDARTSRARATPPSSFPSPAKPTDKSVDELQRGGSPSDDDGGHPVVGGDSVQAPPNAAKVAARRDSDGGLSGLVVTKEDWWTALAAAPLPCSRREAAAAVNGSLPAPPPAHEVALAAPAAAAAVLQLAAAGLAVQPDVTAAAAALVAAMDSSSEDMPGGRHTATTSAATAATPPPCAAASADASPDVDPVTTAVNRFVQSLADVKAVQPLPQPLPVQQPLHPPKQQQERQHGTQPPPVGCRLLLCGEGDQGQDAVAAILLRLLHHISQPHSRSVSPADSKPATVNTSHVDVPQGGVGTPAQPPYSPRVTIHTLNLPSMVLRSGMATAEGVAVLLGEVLEGREGASSRGGPQQQQQHLRVLYLPHIDTWALEQRIIGQEAAGDVVGDSSSDEGLSETDHDESDAYGSEGGSFGECEGNWNPDPEGNESEGDLASLRVCSTISPSWSVVMQGMAATAATAGAPGGTGLMVLATSSLPREQLPKELLEAFGGGAGEEEDGKGLVEGQVGQVGEEEESLREMLRRALAASEVLPEAGAWKAWRGAVAHEHESSKDAQQESYHHQYQQQQQQPRRDGAPKMPFRPCRGIHTAPPCRFIVDLSAPPPAVYAAAAAVAAEQLVSTVRQAVEYGALQNMYTAASAAAARSCEGATTGAAAPLPGPPPRSQSPSSPRPPQSPLLWEPTGTSDAAPGNNGNDGGSTRSEQVEDKAVWSVENPEAAEAVEMCAQGAFNAAELERGCRLLLQVQLAVRSIASSILRRHSVCQRAYTAVRPGGGGGGGGGCLRGTEALVAVARRALAGHIHTLDQLQEEVRSRVTHERTNRRGTDIGACSGHPSRRAAATAAADASDERLHGGYSGGYPHPHSHSTTVMYLWEDDVAAACEAARTALRLDDPENLRLLAAALDCYRRSSKSGSGGSGHVVGSKDGGKDAGKDGKSQANLSGAMTRHNPDTVDSAGGVGCDVGLQCAKTTTAGEGGIGGTALEQPLRNTAQQCDMRQRPGGDMFGSLPPPSSGIEGRSDPSHVSAMVPQLRDEAAALAALVADMLLTRGPLQYRLCSPVCHPTAATKATAGEEVTGQIAAFKGRIHRKGDSLLAACFAATSIPGSVYRPSIREDRSSSTQDVLSSRDGPDGMDMTLADGTRRGAGGKRGMQDDGPVLAAVPIDHALGGCEDGSYEVWVQHMVATSFDPLQAGSGEQAGASIRGRGFGGRQWRVSEAATDSATITRGLQPSSTYRGLVGGVSDVITGRGCDACGKDGGGGGGGEGGMNEAGRWRREAAARQVVAELERECLRW